MGLQKCFMDSPKSVSRQGGWQLLSESSTERANIKEFRPSARSKQRVEALWRRQGTSAGTVLAAEGKEKMAQCAQGLPKNKSLNCGQVSGFSSQDSDENGWEHLGFA